MQHESDLEVGLHSFLRPSITTLFNIKCEHTLMEFGWLCFFVLFLAKPSSDTDVTTWDDLYN